MNMDFSQLPPEERALRFTALLLGELPVEEAEAIRQAIAAHPELAREHDRLRRTIELVRETTAMNRKVSVDGTPLRLDDERRGKLLEAFKQPAPRRAAPRSRRWYLPASIAAALVGVFMLALMLPSLARKKARTARMTMFSTDRALSASKGAEAAKVTSLPASGTEAQLAAGSMFGGVPGRRENLSGEGIAATDQRITSGLRYTAPAKSAETPPRSLSGSTIALPVVDGGVQISGGEPAFGVALQELNEQPLASDIAVQRKIQVNRRTAATPTIVLPAATDAEGGDSVRFAYQSPVSGPGTVSFWWKAESADKPSAAPNAVATSPSVSPVVVNEVMYQNLAINGGFPAANIDSYSDGMAGLPVTAQKPLYEPAEDHTLGLKLAVDGEEKSRSKLKAESPTPVPVAPISDGRSRIALLDNDSTVRFGNLAALYDSPTAFPPAPALNPAPATPAPTAPAPVAESRPDSADVVAAASILEAQRGGVGSGGRSGRGNLGGEESAVSLAGTRTTYAGVSAPPAGPRASKGFGDAAVSQTDPGKAGVNVSDLVGHDLPRSRVSDVGVFAGGSLLGPLKPFSERGSERDVTASGRANGDIGGPMKVQDDGATHYVNGVHVVRNSNSWNDYDGDGLTDLFGVDATANSPRSRLSADDKGGMAQLGDWPAIGRMFASGTGIGSGGFGGAAQKEQSTLSGDRNTYAVGGAVNRAGGAEPGEQTKENAETTFGYHYESLNSSLLVRSPQVPNDANAHATFQLSAQAAGAQSNRESSPTRNEGEVRQTADFNESRWGVAPNSVYRSRLLLSDANEDAKEKLAKSEGFPPAGGASPNQPVGVQGGSAPTTLETRSFAVDKSALQTGLQNVTAFSFGESQGGAGGGAGGGGGRRGRGRGGNSSSTPAQPQASPAADTPSLEGFFQTAGVDLTKAGKSVSFDDRSGALAVRGTPADFDAIEKSLEMLKAPAPQILAGAEFKDSTFSPEAVPAGTIVQGVESKKPVPQDQPAVALSKSGAESAKPITVRGITIPNVSAPTNAVALTGLTAPAVSDGLIVNYTTTNGVVVDSISPIADPTGNGGVPVQLPSMVTDEQFGRQSSPTRTQDKSGGEILYLYAAGNDGVQNGAGARPLMGLGANASAGKSVTVAAVEQARAKPISTFGDVVTNLAGPEVRFANTAVGHFSNAVVVRNGEKSIGELSEDLATRRFLNERIGQNVALAEMEAAKPAGGTVQIIERAEAESSQSPSLWSRISGRFGGTSQSRTLLAIEADLPDVSPSAGTVYFRSPVDPFFIQTEFNRIQSSNVLRKVAEKLKLNEAWAGKHGGGSKLSDEATLALLKKRVEAKQSHNTSLIEVQAKGDTSEEAAQIANTVADVYKEVRGAARAQLTSAGLASLKEQLVERDKEVAAKQRELDRRRLELNADKPLPKPPPGAPTPQPEVLTRDNAFSTFSLNVSDVSFKLAAASLEKGQMPDAAGIRSEEFLNAFDYRDPLPAAGVPVAFAFERARYPFAHNRDALRFSVKTAALGRDGGRPLNIVLLLDNSGSMERADRVRIIQESLRTLADQLQPQDKLSVVSFSRTATLRADGVTGAKAAELAKQIGTLTPEGGTNLEDAMDLAYRTALRHYAAAAINRVVLLTDGAANLGNVEPKALKAKVESFRKQGVALDCFGIGWDGFNDDLLEQLSRNGDGRYGYINAPEEAATEFAGQLAGALRVAASDVKVQVEFNPKRVTAYRQVGYAKHQLTKQQFRDNTVDAAEIGASEAGNGLYIIETNPNGEGPIATVRARFRIPQTSDYREHEWVVPYGSAVDVEQSSAAMRLATSASAFSEWLASSPFSGEVTTDRLLGLMSGVPEVFGADARPKKLEWMIRQAKSISGK